MITGSDTRGIEYSILIFSAGWRGKEFRMVQHNSKKCTLWTGPLYCDVKSQFASESCFSAHIMHLHSVLCNLQWWKTKLGIVLWTNPALHRHTTAFPQSVLQNPHIVVLVLTRTRKENLMFKEHYLLVLSKTAVVDQQEKCGETTVNTRAEKKWTLG